MSLRVLAFACRHDAFFYFHNINAFESGDDLCIDLAAYEDNQIIVHLHRANLLFNLQPHAPAIPRRSARSCGLLIGFAVCLLFISLCISLCPLVISLCLLLIFLCLSAVGFGPRLVAFARLLLEASVNHLWSGACYACASAHQTCPSRPPMFQSALPLLPIIPSRWAVPIPLCILNQCQCVRANN